VKTVNQAKPRNIALLLESDGPGGAEVVVFQLGEELTRRGHRVFFLGPRHGNGWLGQRFADAGIHTSTFLKRHVLDPRWVTDLCHFFQKQQIEVVHGHEFTMAVYGTLAARRMGLPIVNTFHGDEGMTRVWRRRLALRSTIPLSSASVAVSSATQRQLVADLGMGADDIGVIRNGVPVRKGDRDSVRRELNISENELMILAVGNLEQRKGHMVLLEALKELAESAPDTQWRLVIAGGRGGPMHEPLVAFANNNGFGHRLHVLTYRNDIPDLQAAADLFVMPSLWEGLPLALLEAMLAGKAILASATSGIPEAITHEVDGLLTAPGDSQSLGRGLWRLVTDADLRAKLGSNARNRGNTEFTIGVMTDRYEHIYSSAYSREQLKSEVL
jgi:glycosyltransferase involved in cell wall biosynthesis